ncbi:MAG: hypothetical protein NC400_04015 [Clostridium sp.]|nr:hypothetical protein [Clostridium sp.]
MRTIFIEGLIGVILFTAVIVSVTLKNPLASAGDYPPAIQRIRLKKQRNEGSDGEK